MYPLLRPLIFRADPERAHVLTVQLLRLAGATPAGRALLRLVFRPSRPGLAVQAFGLTFPNPIGLAAGYDKDGLAWRGLACLGFGHLELGTVTPLAQPGNPSPRIFRLPEQNAVINRMGFPGRGAAFLAGRLRRPRPRSLVLGVNIGKNKATPLERAGQDYLSLLETFAPLADYLAVNISSPNTPGLRSLQARKALEELLYPLAARRAELARDLGRPIPLLVKLSPDLSPEDLDQALDVILSAGMDGVIAANTTLSREGVEGHPLSSEVGGLSGAPLKERNTAMLRCIAGRLQGRLPIVASGGVMCAADAREKLEAGATLVQVYTGLIYAGPGFVRQILTDL